MYWCLISSCWINNKLHGAQRVYRILQVRGTDISDVQQKKVKWNCLASTAVLETLKKNYEMVTNKISLGEKYSTLLYFTLLLPLLSSLCFFYDIFGCVLPMQHNGNHQQALPGKQKTIFWNFDWGKYCQRLLHPFHRFIVFNLIFSAKWCPW